MRVNEGSGVNPLGESRPMDETSTEMRAPELPKTGGRAGKIDPEGTLGKIRGRIPEAITRRAGAVGKSPLSLLPFSTEGDSTSEVVQQIVLRVWGRRGS